MNSSKYIFSGEHSADMWDEINNAKSKSELRGALYFVCCRIQQLESDFRKKIEELNVMTREKSGRMKISRLIKDKDGYIKEIANLNAEIERLKRCYCALMGDDGNCMHDAVIDWDLFNDDEMEDNDA